MATTVDAERVLEYAEPDEATFNAKLDTLAQLVRKSRYTVFYTGAGVSTSSGIGDYRGPSGVWTARKIRQLHERKKSGALSAEESDELAKLETAAAQEEKKAAIKLDRSEASPTVSHMVMVTMIRLKLAHFAVTTNLDGLFRKAGLVEHQTAAFLHGDIFIERCTGCGHEFERNYPVRHPKRHVHDHHVGTCARCGSAPPPHYTGAPGDAEMQHSKWGGLLVGTQDRNCGTKDTHINFGEYLDDIDLEDAQKHCKKADLCIVAGTSMSLRHITHLPFLAKKVVIVNLQATPDDDKAALRIWAKCDAVFVGLAQRLNIEIDPVPVWRPRDAVPIDRIPNWVAPNAVAMARRYEEAAAQAGVPLFPATE